MSRFNIGDVVRISKKSEFYNDTWDSNPKDMDGTVTLNNDWEHGHQVEWDNGYNNAYDEDDLKLVRRA